MRNTKRLFDILLASMLIVICAIPMASIALLVLLTSRGPVLYWSDRAGAGNTIFRMPKFRTMKVGTPVLATHLVQDPGRYITTLGAFLRKTSLDELPQLWNILKGDMSFVGPRPALYNQDDLIALRTQKGVHVLIPGLTGWAQIHGRDELSILRKAEYDEYYLMHQSFWMDIVILCKTLFQTIQGKGVTH